MNRHMILIGFMGAGKTSVGRCLSRIAGLPVVDTDDLIVESAGMSIPDVFIRQGEEGFRRLETGVLKGLLRREEDAVISVGGGLPLREENRCILKQLGTVVFLRVKPETVLVRLAGDDNRPMLQAPDRAVRVRELMDYRNPIYTQAADLIVDADDRTPREIAQWLWKNQIKSEEGEK